MRVEIARLKRRPDFLRVARANAKAVRPGLILQSCRTEGDVAASRLGFTVSRKVGGAVQRNRARRRLRAAATAVMPDHAAPGRDYVLIGRGGTLDRSFEALKRDLEEALKRLSCWREEGAECGSSA